MAASDRKIAAMYRHFGIYRGYQCRDCSNLKRYEQGRTYFKCSVYGDSRSAATDWAQSRTACGMFDKEYKGRLIIDVLKHSARPKPSEQIEGQIDFGEVMSND